MQKHTTELTCAWETLEYTEYTRFLRSLHSIPCERYVRPAGEQRHAAGYARCRKVMRPRVRS
jgi:hypothetical protein